MKKTHISPAALRAIWTAVGITCAIYLLGFAMYAARHFEEFAAVVTRVR